MTESKHIPAIELREMGNRMKTLVKEKILPLKDAVKLAGIKVEKKAVPIDDLAEEIRMAVIEGLKSGVIDADEVRRVIRSKQN